jgi:hypothetical protein
MKACRLLAVLAALTTTLCASSRAHACWDGHQATVGRVGLSAPGDARWRPEDVRKAALWGTRIDALLPPGTLVSAFGSYVSWCTEGANGDCGETLAELSWERGDPADLFPKIAAATGASKETIRRARGLGAQPLTLQVFAAYDRARAEALATRINEADMRDLNNSLNGFYKAGGFPGFNPSAHVLEGTDARGATLYRVVVGAFLSETEAAAAGATLEEALGIRGFSRPL